MGGGCSPSQIKSACVCVSREKQKVKERKRTISKGERPGWRVSGNGIFLFGTGTHAKRPGQGKKISISFRSPSFVFD